jgi:predicted transcriptional regulator
MYFVGEDIITETKNITITAEDIRIRADGQTQTMYQYKCNDCGYDCKDLYYGGKYIAEMWYTPAQLRNNKQCSCCSHRVVKSDINSIAKTHPHLVQYFADKTTAEKYSMSSNQKEHMKCPYCGTEKDMCIADLYKNGFSCPCCSDGLSMGERIVYMILSDNNIEFIKEYKFDNSKYRYDFYLKDFNMIIEVNGKQHYAETSISRGAKTLEDEIKNDVNKKEFALSKGIEKYIYVDCRKSDVNYIIDSIKNTEILNILHIQNIDDSLIKEKIHTHSITKVICDMYNSRDDVSIREICKKLHFDKSTVRRHLKIGADLNWCDYNVKTYRWSKRSDNYVGDANDGGILSIPIKCNDKYFKNANICSNLSEKLFGKLIPNYTIRRRASKRTKNNNPDYIFEYISREEFNKAIENNLECYGTPFLL